MSVEELDVVEDLPAPPGANTAVRTLVADPGTSAARSAHQLHAGRHPSTCLGEEPERGDLARVLLLRDHHLSTQACSRPSGPRRRESGEPVFVDLRPVSGCGGLRRGRGADVRGLGVLAPTGPGRTGWASRPVGRSWTSAAAHRSDRDIGDMSCTGAAHVARPAIRPRRPADPGRDPGPRAIVSRSIRVALVHGEEVRRAVHGDVGGSPPQAQREHVGGRSTGGRTPRSTGPTPERARTPRHLVGGDRRSRPGPAHEDAEVRLSAGDLLSDEPGELGPGVARLDDLHRLRNGGTPARPVTHSFRSSVPNATLCRTPLSSFSSLPCRQCRGAVSEPQQVRSRSPVDDVHHLVQVDARAGPEVRPFAVVIGTAPSAPPQGHPSCVGGAA